MSDSQIRIAPIPGNMSDNSIQYCVTTVDGRLEPPLDPFEADSIAQEFGVHCVVDNRYTLLKLIGAGGMGQVFLAHDRRLDRRVAIKVVSRNCVRNAATLARHLEREAKLAANLNHPGIAVVHDFGVHASRPYVVFEFVDGNNLRYSLRRGPIGLEKTRELIMPLCRALDFAHGNGVIHRDLKPENICLAGNGICKILDFGLALDSKVDGVEQGFAGTPAYAAPEQADGRAVDGRTDQYALACVVFELITGERVFKDNNQLNLIIAHANTRPRRISDLIPEIPVEVDQAVDRALQKSPESRFDSCQEFAEALGCDPGRILEKRLRSEAIHFFVSHTSEDSIFARRLARRLDQSGYSTWYYQRDALPGLSLLAQTNEKIRESAACIFLISRASIESADFSREIQQAHRSNCAMIPVLLEMSLQEFENVKPGWRTMLGPIVKFEAGPNDDAELASKIDSVAASYVGLPANKHDSQGLSPILDRVSGQVWATDAYQIDINELGKVVFENEVIKEFLRRRNKFFVSATKGLGKTLLLTYRRHLLTQENRENSQQTTMVPVGRPYLDFMGDLRILSEKYERPLSELTTAKRIWSLALRIASISYQDGMIDEDEKFELEPFPQRLRRALTGNKMEPTLVFKELTRLTVSELNRLIDESEGFLDQKLRQVHSPIVFFIDKVDQAIRKLNTDAWINVQAGLIEAAWDLMNANSHIKVYASIRHEAFCNYESDIKANLRGAVSVLRYTDDDLAQILDQLSRCYEARESFKDFVGLNVVNSGRRPFLEDSFQMIRRFTFGRPRDLVLLASEMSSSKGALNEKKYCEIVRETAATGLVPTIIDESRVFLKCLQDSKARFGFLSMIPSNILSQSQVWEISADFNSVPQQTFADQQEIEGFSYPFLDLYLAGLLGVVVEHAEDTEAKQQFRQADDLLTNIQFRLPKSDFYVLHPALERFIERSGVGESFQVSRQIRVGHGLPWRDYFPLICQAETALAKVDSSRFSQIAYHLLTRFQAMAVANIGDQPAEDLGSTTDFQTLEELAVCEYSKETVMWLIELFK